MKMVVKGPGRDMSEDLAKRACRHVLCHIEHSAVKEQLSKVDLSFECDPAQQDFALIAVGCTRPKDVKEVAFLGTVIFALGESGLFNKLQVTGLQV